MHFFFNSFCCSLFESSTLIDFLESFLKLVDIVVDQVLLVHSVLRDQADQCETLINLFEV